MPSMLDIHHILIMMMENRSFDHYLGALTLEGRTYRRDTDADAQQTFRPGPSDRDEPARGRSCSGDGVALRASIESQLECAA